MTDVSPTSSNGDSFVTTYEQLRSGVVQGTKEVGHFGLMLLLREGLAAWLARASTFLISPLPPIKKTLDATPLACDEMRAGIIRVFAAMAIAGTQESNA